MIYLGEIKKIISLEPKEVKMKRGKRYLEAEKLVEKGKLYEAEEALNLIEKFPKTKLASSTSKTKLLIIINIAITYKCQ